MFERSELMDAMKSHVGREHGISAAELVVKLIGTDERTAVATGLRRLRHLIVDLRLDGVKFCGHPRTGYFLAETAEEMLGTIEFLYSRAMKSLLQISRLNNIGMPDLRGQLGLPVGEAAQA